MENLSSYITEAMSKTQRNKNFLDDLVKYASENGYTKGSDDYLYKSFPKENTIDQKTSHVIFFSKDGIGIQVGQYNQSRKKTLMVAYAVAYSDKGYLISKHAINLTGDKNETFDLANIDVEDIKSKIQKLLDKKTIDKIVKNYYKKREDNSGYAYKFDDFDHSEIKYEDIK